MPREDRLASFTCRPAVVESCQGVELGVVTLLDEYLGGMGTQIGVDESSLPKCSSGDLRSLEVVDMSCPAGLAGSGSGVETVWGDSERMIMLSERQGDFAAVWGTLRLL
jgi:hypothetical protein